MLCFRFLSMVCVFKHLFCSAQLSMSNMEKRYRNKIIIIIITSCRTHDRYFSFSAWYGGREQLWRRVHLRASHPDPTQRPPTSQPGRSTPLPWLHLHCRLVTWRPLTFCCPATSQPIDVQLIKVTLSCPASLALKLGQRAACAVLCETDGTRLNFQVSQDDGLGTLHPVYVLDSLPMDSDYHRVSLQMESKCHGRLQMDDDYWVGQSTDGH